MGSPLPMAMYSSSGGWPTYEAYVSRWRFDTHSLRACQRWSTRDRGDNPQFGGVGVACTDVAGLQLLKLLGGTKFIGHDEDGVEVKKTRGL